MVAELAERLFRGDVASLRVDATAPAPELARFARLLARWERREDPDQLLTERLIDEGISAVRVDLTARLRVLDLRALSSADERQLRVERRARGEAPQPVDEDGSAWVRVETDIGLASLDLADLAFLIDDPLELASLLHEARGDRTDGHGGAEILSGVLPDLVDLYGRLSPDVAAERFRDLAGTLTSMDGPTRWQLIDEVLVPDLLETGRPAALVGALPDEEIAHMLQRLGERQLGAPGLIEHSLERAGLGREREGIVRDALGPEGRTGGVIAGSSDAGDHRRLRAGRRLEGSGAAGATLRELAVRDLAVDAATEEALAALRVETTAATEMEERLRGHARLVRHVLNPEVADGFLARTTESLRTLSVRGEGETAAGWIDELRLAADAVRARSPEVAGAVDRALLGLCSVEFVRRGLGESEEPEAALHAREMIEALGPLAAPQLLEALEQEPSRGARRRLIDFMFERARALAPGLPPYLADARWTVVRNAAAVLGFAGEGQEESLTPLLDHDEPRVAREAFLAMARIGSESAARRVAERAASTDRRVREMACESIRRFPRETGRRLAAEVLADRGVHLSWPDAARGLLRHFFAEGSDEADRTTLEPLLPLRFHVWHPGRLRLGWAAWIALRRIGNR